jgi:probable rRNA maturation factor
MKISAISTSRPCLRQEKIEILGLKNQKLIKELKRLAQTILAEKKSQGKTISIIFVDNEYIRQLNRKYLKRNRITDVLAFPFENDFLGEVYVCRQRTKKQAKEFGLTEKEEIFRLVDHGVMHLLGYHH